MALTPRQVFFGTPASDTHPPDRLDIVNLLDWIIDQAEAAAAGITIETTWAALSAKTVSSDGAGGRVTGPDAGTHVDPVTGATVANEGEYRGDLTAGGWQRTGDSLTPGAVEDVRDEVEAARAGATSLSDRLSPLRTTAEAKHRIRDEDGFVFAMISNLLGFSMQGFRLTPSGYGGLRVKDGDGFVIAVFDASGVRYKGAGGEGGSSAITQVVELAFVEPWTDPSKDAVITWISNSASQKAVEYQVDGATIWQAVGSQRSRAFPNQADTYIHSAFLPNVSPDTLYNIRWPGASKVDKFRTAKRSNVRVAFLSDFQDFAFGASPVLADFGTQVQAEAPDFLALGGDYVNDDGRFDETQASRWRSFLGGFVERYRRGGALIPLFAMMGNHEGRNIEDTASASAGGDGTPGMVTEIFSFGYDPENPVRNVRSGSKLSIGSELLILTLETDHTVPLPSQLAWFEETLAAEAGNHRNVVVYGHCPAFCGMGTFDFGHVDTQARYLRNFFWPAMEPYASKIRFYVGGHEHILAVTDRLRMDYDPGLTLAENDTRWAVDAVNGIRQIGNGPWAAGRLDVDPARAGELSTIDGSAKMIAAMGYDEVNDQVQTFGTGITNADPEIWNIWIADFSADAFFVKAIGRTGQQFYEISEAL